MGNKKNVIPYIGLIVIVILFSALTRGRLLSVANLKLIFNQTIVLMIGCIGVTFIMTLGSLDLSQGSLMGFCAAVGATVAAYSPNATFFTVIIVGAAIGCIHGLLHGYLKIPSFILTLCSLFILRGFTVVITKSGSLPIPFSMYSYDSFSLKIVVLLIVFMVSVYLFNYTRFGKDLKAIGSGERAADYSGVPVKRMKMFAFIIAGLLCGVCSYLNVLRTGAADSKTGLLFEIDILTALVVGGLPLTGGAKSKLRCAIIGALVLTVLTNGMVLVGLKTELQQAVKGIIFLLSVYLSFEKDNVLYVK